MKKQYMVLYEAEGRWHQVHEEDEEMGIVYPTRAIAEAVKTIFGYTCSCLPCSIVEVELPEITEED